MSKVVRGGENVRKGEGRQRAWRDSTPLLFLLSFFWCSHKEWGSSVEVLNEAGVFD